MISAMTLILIYAVVNFPFLDGDVPRSTSYGVYISHLIRFTRVSSHVADFNARNKSLTAKLLQQGYRYHKLRKTFYPNFIADTMNWFLSSMLDYEHFCIKAYWNRNFMVTYKLKKMYIGLIFLISSENLSYLTNVLDIT